MDDTPDLATFRAIAAAHGLRLGEEELARMREGYVGILRMRARLPADLPMADEPAAVFLPAGARVTA